MFYVRYGNRPENDISINHNTQEKEYGVSVFSAKELTNGEIVIQANSEIRTLPRVMNRNVYVIHGAQEVGKGSDGEPVIKGGTWKKY